MTAWCQDAFALVVRIASFFDFSCRWNKSSKGTVSHRTHRFLHVHIINVSLAWLGKQNKTIQYWGLNIDVFFFLFLARLQLQLKDKPHYKWLSPSIHLSIHLPSIQPSSIYPFIFHLSNHPSSVYSPFTCPSIHSSYIHPSIFLSIVSAFFSFINHSFIHPSIIYLLLRSSVPPPIHHPSSWS